MISRYNTSLGHSVSNSLAQSRMTAAALAAVTGTSPAYVSQVLTGKKSASEKFIDKISAAMQLGSKQRAELHRLAKLQKKSRLTVSLDK